jgi:hypothetical protein
MSTTPELPAPCRDPRSQRLFWDAFEVENYKRALLNMPPLERDPSEPIKLLTSRDLEAQLPFGRRTIARMVGGRERTFPATA